jgi:hypothetical protein
MFWIQINLYVKKCSFKYGDVCFIGFYQKTIIYKDLNVTQMLSFTIIDKFFYFVYELKISNLHNYDM